MCIDRQPVDEDSELETTCRFHAATKDASEAHVRALLLQAISGHGYQLRGLESANVAGTNLVDVSAELVPLRRNDEQIETAAGRLGLEPNVTSVRWQAIERNGQASLADRDAAPDE